MAVYVGKQVDAVQWQPGDGGPDVCEECTACSTPHVHVVGGWNYLNPGDWIVTKQSGERITLSSELFAETYDPV